MNRVTPHCCHQSQKTPAVFLQMPAGWADGDTSPPTWCVLLVNSDGLYSGVEATHCPFCGKGLPPISPVTVKRQICKCTDGGYYCDTCRERLRCCECLPPEFAWGPTP